MRNTAFILAAVIACGGSVAMADLVAVGDPFDVGSWKQGFTESGIGTFDFVAVRMVTAGDTFEKPVQSGFNRSGWAEDYLNDPVYPTIATAKGSDVTNMSWNIRFAGSTSNTFTFDYVALDYTDTGWALKNAARATWNSGWHITNYPSGQGAWWTPPTPEIIEAPVPAPGAVLLGAMGLGVVGFVRRRFAK